MANVVNDVILQSGLRILDSDSDKVYIVSQDPGNYTEATSTYALGNKNFGAGAVFGSCYAGSPNGQRVTSAPITDGTVTANGTANGWAVVTSGSSRLDVNGDLSAPQVVASGNTFTLGAFDVRIPNQ
jgi:hypothetical protein